MFKCFTDSCNNLVNECPGWCDTCFKGDNMEPNVADELYDPLMEMLGDGWIVKMSHDGESYTISAYCSAEARGKFHVNGFNPSVLMEELADLTREVYEGN